MLGDSVVGFSFNFTAAPYVTFEQLQDALGILNYYFYLCLALNSQIT